MSLCRIGHGRTVPPEIYRSRPIRAMENAAADYACLLNDVFSYQKEIQFEGEFHNGVPGRAELPRLRPGRGLRPGERPDDGADAAVRAPGGGRSAGPVHRLRARRRGPPHAHRVRRGAAELDVRNSRLARGRRAVQGSRHAEPGRRTGQTAASSRWCHRSGYLRGSSAPDHDSSLARRDWTVHCDGDRSGQAAAESRDRGRPAAGDHHQVGTADAGHLAPLVAQDAAVGGDPGRRVPGQPPNQLRGRRRSAELLGHRRRRPGDPGRADRAAAVARTSPTTTC